jgi:peptide/nickel transport system permease protein
LQQDYITMASAKGLPWRVIILRHAFRNALLPIITVIALSVPNVVGGAVVLETVFDWPGMGQLAVVAAGNRDVNLVMGIVLTVAISVIVANFIADVAYVRADPRIQLG